MLFSKNQAKNHSSDLCNTIDHSLYYFGTKSVWCVRTLLFKGSYPNFVVYIFVIEKWLTFSTLKGASMLKAVLDFLGCFWLNYSHTLSIVISKQIQ